MIKCFLTTYCIQLSTSINRWLYYLRKIPFIKQLFPVSLYHKIGIKSGLSIIMIGYSILYELFKKSFYVAFLFALVMLGVPSNGHRLIAFLQLFLFFSVIGGSLNHTMMLQNDEMNHLFLKIMRMNRSLYIRTNLYREYLEYIVFLLPGMIVVILRLNGNPLLAPALLLLALGAHTAIDYLQLKLFEKRQTLSFIKHMNKLFIVSGVIFIIGFLLIQQGWLLLSLDRIGYIGYLGLPVSIMVILNINRYPYFYEASQLSFRYYHQMILETGTDRTVAFQDVAIRDKDISEMTGDRNAFSNRHGYEYLNAVFFHRQKRIFFRPVRNRLFMLITIALIILVAGRIYGVHKVSSTTLNSMFPGLVFIMYCINIGTRATRSLFYNCDASLLQYSFYRRKDAVLKNFAIRFRHLTMYNMIPAVALCILLVIGFRILNITIEPLTMTIAILTILLLSVLFTLHYLFLYYVFQPFTKEYNVKNPFYTILNSAMYIVCFTIINVHVEITNFIIYVFLFTIAYILIALICVYRYAPKTFRIK